MKTKPPTILADTVDLYTVPGEVDTPEIRNPEKISEISRKEQHDLIRKTNLFLRQNLR